MMEAGAGHDGCVQVLLDRGVQVNHQDKVITNFATCAMHASLLFVLLLR